MSIALQAKVAELEQRVSDLEAALMALADRIGPVAAERVSKTLSLPEKRKRA